MSLRRPNVRAHSSASSECSDGSERSRSTAPTLYSLRSTRKHQGIAFTGDKRHTLSVEGTPCPGTAYQASIESVETYASTDESEDEGGAEAEEGQEEESYEAPALTAQTRGYQPWPTLPSSPSEFARFFPSTRRLHIHHANAVDGNMNLSIDTEITTSDGNRADLTLFHLRMHDLKNREFSLRRYYRESGREVCHSTRKYTRPAAEKRPGLQRSMSSALASLRDRSTARPGLKRADSGHASISGDHGEVHSARFTPKATNIQLPTNTTKLEFSNYAHIDLRRRGTKSSKRYEFEYWGASYAWRRHIKQGGSVKETSYQLYRADSSRPIAHIVPIPMEEESKGGWIPSSSMWIGDGHALNSPTDVADVIVATGLMAFVDDRIKSRWHRKDRFRLPSLSILSSMKKLNTESADSRRLASEALLRRGDSSVGRCSPLRQLSGRA